MPRLDPELSARAVAGLRGVLGIGVAFGAVGLGLAREDEWTLLAAIGQLAVLSGAAWTSLQAGWLWGFRAGVALVCTAPSLPRLPLLIYLILNVVDR